MKKHTFPIIFLLMVTWSSEGMDPSGFLKYISSLPVSKRQIKVDSFQNARHVFPVIHSDTTCTFFYIGDADTVSIAGDFTGWTPSPPFSRMGGTNLWYTSRKFEKDARLDYKLVINNKNWIKDPSNPDSCAGGAGTNSELKMPEYIVPPEISFHREISHGSLTEAGFPTGNIKPRKITVYVPADFDREHKEYPVIVFNDGTDYLEYGAAQNILDYLIFNQQIEPVIGVFIPPVEREEEYAGKLKDDYAKFILETVMPVMESKYNVSKDPRKRIIAGVSNGGNIALYIALKHPESFGKVIAQSSNVESEFLSLVKNKNVKDVRFYMDLGTYDINVLIPRVNNFLKALQDENRIYTFRQWHEGHSWGNWKGHLRFPLVECLNLEAGYNDNHNK